jgi:hypothetical protein
VNLIVRELANYQLRIALFTDRDSRTEQRHLKKLLEKLRQVKWTP